MYPHDTHNENSLLSHTYQTHLICAKFTTFHPVPKVKKRSEKRKKEICVVVKQCILSVGIDMLGYVRCSSRHRKVIYVGCALYYFWWPSPICASRIVKPNFSGTRVTAKRKKLWKFFSSLFFPWPPSNSYITVDHLLD